MAQAQQQAAPAGGNDDKENLALTNALRHGGAEGFARVVQACHQDLLTLVYRLLGWSDEAEDVVQDVLLAAYHKRRQFKGSGSLKAWLFRIAVNRCRTWRYRRLLHLRFLNHARENTLVWEHPSTESQSLEQENLLEVRRAIQKLPTRYREPMVLRYLQELSSEATASILGITSNAVNVRLKRGRDMIKEQLTQHEA
jgi:RNA polymerase sigma-70 factor (ECF subfamily)